MHGIWETLGIPSTQDVRAIKRAYAAALKCCHPEDDPEGFRRLHAAYEAALAQAETRVLPVMQAPPPPTELAAMPARGAWRPPLDPLREDSPRPVALRSQEEAAAPAEPEADPAEDARRVIACLQRAGAAAALALLERSLDAPLYRSLWAKEQLQKGLLDALPLHYPAPMPLEFLCALAERFGWEDGRHPFQRAYPRQFQLLRRARDEHRARRLLEDYAAGRNRQPNLLQRLLYRRAARLLLGRTPRPVYVALNVDPLLRDSVSLLLKRIHQAYPLASEAVFDAAALRWCRTQLLGKTLPKLIGYVLLVLNALLNMVLGILVTDAVSGWSFFRDHPDAGIAFGLVAGLPVALALQFLWANLIQAWIDRPRLYATEKRRQAAFWGATALLYLLIVALPVVPGLYLWGLALALFLLRIPNLQTLVVTFFLGGLSWGIMDAALGPHGYSGPEDQGWSRLFSPFLGCVYMIAVLQLHRWLTARRRTQPANPWWSYLGLTFGITVAGSLGLALLVQALG